MNAPYFVISDAQLVEMGQLWCTDEYVISADDYYKINIGDKVELDMNNIGLTGEVKVVKIN